MRRDMELVRKILLFLQNSQGNHERYYDNEDGTYSLIPIEGYSKDQVDYHLTIMKEADLIKGNLPMGDNVLITHIGARLNWNGHEFLESFSNERVWQRTKENIKNKGLEVGSVPFEVLKEYGKMQMRKYFGID